MGRAKKPQNIKLFIKGPKSLLKKNNSVVVETQSNRTWISLLREDLGVKVSPTSGFFACSEHYSVTNPEIGKGWRSELSESISEFVGKFKKRRELINVRISNGKGVARLETHLNLTSASSASKKRTKGKKVRRLTSLNGNRKCQTRSVSTSDHIGGFPGEDTGTATLKLDPSPDLENSNKENMGAKKVGRKTRIVRRATLLNDNLKCQTRSVSKRDHHRGLHGNVTGRSTVKHDPSPTSTTSNKENANKVATKPSTPKQLRRMGNIFWTPQIDNVRSIVKNERRSSDNCDKSQTDNDDNDEEEETRKQLSKKNVYNGNVNDSDTSADEDNRDNDEDDNDRHNFDDDYDNCDLSSYFTAVTVENMELREAGIQVEDVKSLVEGRVPRFSNAYLLRVKNEINKKKQNNVWIRNVKRAPLACYLLEELFK